MPPNQSRYIESDERRSGEVFRSAHLPSYRFESAEPAFWLESLYVVPDFRRSGVARALMATVSADSLARGAAALYWGVRMVNDGGKGFYASIKAQSEKAEILALFRDEMTALTQ
ncbi:MAG: GNAT family N-acetyltransferase [Minwuia sp.]|nr:GNAT family N-acetyltransferase [Minwuia sp.]